MTDLERATAMAVEALGLSQLSELETCNSAIAGDFMDLMDTTDMPSAAVSAHFLLLSSGGER